MFLGGSNMKIIVLGCSLGQVTVLYVIRSALRFDVAWLMLSSDSGVD